MELGIELAKSDLIMAKQGINVYESSQIKAIKGSVGYHLQQAIEKLIKLQIYKSGVPYNNAKMYTHSIENLIKYANELGIRLNVPKEIMTNAELITAWEAGGRYDLGFSININTLKKYYNITYNWYNTLHKNKALRSR